MLFRAYFIHYGMRTIPLFQVTCYTVRPFRPMVTLPWCVMTCRLWLGARRIIISCLAVFGITIIRSTFTGGIIPFMSATPFPVILPRLQYTTFAETTSRACSVRTKTDQKQILQKPFSQRFFRRRQLRLAHRPAEPPQEAAVLPGQCRVVMAEPVQRHCRTPVQG